MEKKGKKVEEIWFPEGPHGEETHSQSRPLTSVLS